MPVLRLVNFGGAIPMLGDRALPDGFATRSINTWFYGNEMRGIRVEKDLETLPGTTQKVFRLPKGTVGGDPHYIGAPPPSYVGDDKWVLLPHKDTDIVGSAMANDQWHRWYFCDPVNGPYWNTKDRLLAGSPMYVLGAFGPPGDGFYMPYFTAATGGSGTITETRAYLYTWVNEYNEETHPSLPNNFSALSNATWNIYNILDPPAPLQPAPPPGMVYPAWKHKVLYRTIVSASGIVNYYKVAEIPIGTPTYADSKLTTQIVNELPLESTSWRQPPRDLQGFIGMPNGFLIGFKGKDIYMSEPYHFHAWPEEYKHTEEYEIVGLGTVDTTCVVCTQGYPGSISGMKPAIMSFNKANTNEPCLSRGSIVSTPTSVIYASPNGLMSLGPQGFVNATEKIITKTKWQQAYAPAFLRGVRFANGYLALRDVPLQDLDEPEGPKRSIFFLDQTDLKVALTEMQNFDKVQNIQNDVFSGEVFLTTTAPDNLNVILQLWDPVSPWDPDLWKPVQWRSKEFQFQYKENFSCFSIYWDEERFTSTPDCEHIMPADEHVHFTVWADRQVIYDETVPVDGRPVRLPSGFKSDVWQFEVKARAPVYSVHVASTIKELKGV